jgi:hypothetical protein
VIVYAEINQVFVSAVADSFSHERSGEHTISVPAWNEVNSVSGLEQRPSQQSCPASSLYNPGSDHGTVLVVVSWEEVRK